LKGFPGLTKDKRKTPNQGGGGLRKRWKDKKGNIYEWDSRHGALEKYDKQGWHLGQFDYITGKQTKPADKTRRIQK
jgi:cytotoxic domain protein